MNDSKQPKAKYVGLMIHKTEGDSESVQVPVSVNGKTWLIRRGENVSVPDYVVEVLRNAVKDVFHTDNEGQLVHRQVPSYPFSVA